MGVVEARVGPEHHVADGRGSTPGEDDFDEGAPAPPAPEVAIEIEPVQLANSLAHALVYVMARERQLGVPPRSSPEATITRRFEVPTDRTFAVTGDARVNAAAASAATLAATNAARGSAW